MVASPRLVNEGVTLRAPGERAEEIERLEDRTGVRLAAADVVHLGNPRLRPERMHERRDVV